MELADAAKPEPAIRIREAIEADSEMLWLWRNDPVTRIASRTKDPIPWNMHQVWYSSVMADPNRHLFVAEADGSAVAMIRFDWLESGREACEISINVRPDARGSGLGRAVLSAACAEFAATHSVARIFASIAEGNQSSRRLFEACGFLAAGAADAQGFAPYVWEANSGAVGGRMCG
jgi:L-amino acid N-acyltransferase YncA